MVVVVVAAAVQSTSLHEYCKALLLTLHIDGRNRIVVGAVMNTMEKKA